MRRPLLLMAALSALCANAQSLERQVLGSGGTYFYQAAVGSLSWTAGEAATATLVSIGNALTQGFQQPLEGEFGTTVRPTAATDAALQLYPNPAHNQLICMDTQLRALRFVVRDAAGRVVQVERTAFAGEHRFDVAELAYGPYWLTVEDADGATWSLPFIKH